MSIKKEIGKKIIKDAVISLFIYTLPVLLMLIFFLVTGNRPWKNQSQPNVTSQSEARKTK